MKNLAVALLATLSLLVQADPALSFSERDHRAYMAMSSDYAAADSELNAIWRRLRNACTPEQFRAELKQQKAWLRQRGALGADDGVEAATRVILDRVEVLRGRLAGLEQAAGASGSRSGSRSDRFSEKTHRAWLASSPDYAAADSELNAIWRRLRNACTPEQFQAELKQQKAWLRQRGALGSNNGPEAATRVILDRIEVLRGRLASLEQGAGEYDSLSASRSDDSAGRFSEKTHQAWLASSPDYAAADSELNAAWEKLRSLCPPERLAGESEEQEAWLRNRGRLGSDDGPEEAARVIRDRLALINYKILQLDSTYVSFELASDVDYFDHGRVAFAIVPSRPIRMKEYYATMPSPSTHAEVNRHVLAFLRGELEQVLRRSPRDIAGSLLESRNSGDEIRIDYDRTMPSVPNQFLEYSVEILKEDKISSLVGIRTWGDVPPDRPRNGNERVLFSNSYDRIFFFDSEEKLFLDCGPLDKDSQALYELRAMAGGRDDARFSVACSLLEGKVLPQNLSAARQLFEKSVKYGNMASVEMLGLIHYKGLGVPADRERALGFFMLAAHFESRPAAQMYVGMAYQFGEGVEKDEQEAVRWYQESAKQGFGPGMSCLGMVYRYGIGVEKDLDKARYFLLNACRKGEQAACEEYETIR